MREFHNEEAMLAGGLEGHADRLACVKE